MRRSLLSTIASFRGIRGVSRRGDQEGAATVRESDEVRDLSPIVHRQAVSYADVGDRAQARNRLPRFEYRADGAIGVGEDPGDAGIQGRVEHGLSLIVEAVLGRADK